jgi:uncharacterized SAM-binding protein YcdF (DUF218 family)
VFSVFLAEISDKQKMVETQAVAASAVLLPHQSRNDALQRLYQHFSRDQTTKRQRFT